MKSKDGKGNWQPPMASAIPTLFTLFIMLHIVAGFLCFLPELFALDLSLMLFGCVIAPLFENENKKL